MKLINIIAWVALILGILILVIFVINVSNEYDLVFKDINFDVTGQFGDYIGGVVGTLFALGGTLLIYLNFHEQLNRNRREAFEAIFFEMVKLHRENVSEIEYKDLRNRKVFHAIYKEFNECFLEIKEFSTSIKVDDYLLNEHKEFLSKIIEREKLSVDLIQLGLIDIAYQIIFFGLSNEDYNMLKIKLSKKFQSNYISELLFYIRLKPDSKSTHWYSWLDFNKLNNNQKKIASNECHIYHYKQKRINSSVGQDLYSTLCSRTYIKYYGGHQHRLSHYFRNLFQVYKYLNSQKIDNQYLYGKTLRAQLSTYEQVLLFLNSVSSLGMKWEYTPDTDSTVERDRKEYQMISKFQIIKNIPGIHTSSIEYKRFYPRVNFEIDEPNT